MPLVTLHAVADAFVAVEQPSTNFNAKNFLVVGYEYNSYDTEISGTNGLTRTFVRFDLSSLAGATINSATLSMNLWYNHDNYLEWYLRAQRITDITWDETTVTWINQPTTTTGSPIDHYVFDGDPSTVDIVNFDVATDVTAALSTGGITWRFIQANEDQDNVWGNMTPRHYGSMNYPSLTIDYTPGAPRNNGMLLMF